MNHIIVSGNLAKAPERKNTASGKEYYFFSVASNQRKGQETITTWYSCNAWNLSENFVRYLKSGSSVTVVGSLNPPSIYQSRNGENKVSLNINVSSVEFSPFSGDKKEEGQEQNQGVQSGQQPSSRAVPMDDGLPF